MNRKMNTKGYKDSEKTQLFISFGEPKLNIILNVQNGIITTIKSTTLLKVMLRSGGNKSSH